MTKTCSNCYNNPYITRVSSGKCAANIELHRGHKDDYYHSESNTLIDKCPLWERSRKVQPND